MSVNFEKTSKEVKEKFDADASKKNGEYFNIWEHTLKLEDGGKETLSFVGKVFEVPMHNAAMRFNKKNSEETFTKFGVTCKRAIGEVCPICDNVKREGKSKSGKPYSFPIEPVNSYWHIVLTYDSKGNPINADAPVEIDGKEYKNSPKLSFFKASYTAENDIVNIAEEIGSDKVLSVTRKGKRTDTKYTFIPKVNVTNAEKDVNKDLLKVFIDKLNAYFVNEGSDYNYSHIFKIGDIEFDGSKYYSGEEKSIVVSDDNKKEQNDSVDIDDNNEGDDDLWD